jgi:TonB family protein
VVGSCISSAEELLVRVFFVTLFVFLISFGVATQARTLATLPYPDSADGFRQQLEALISTYKYGNLPVFRAELDTLAIPNANDWIASHFSSADVPKLQRTYRESFAVFDRDMFSMIEDSAQFSPLEIRVKPWEAPLPPTESGPEQGQPSPVQPITVEYFGYGPVHPSRGTTSSWVSSFIYVDGMFRFVGGSYPFWWEELQRLRRARGQSAHLLRKVPPDYPQKARKQLVEGVVRLHVIIGKDGIPREVSVMSGHPLLTDAAIKAVQQWRYEPTLLLGNPVEVDTTIDVVFALNHQSPSQN